VSSISGKLFVSLLATVLLITVSVARAEQTKKKISRIGFLATNSASGENKLRVLRQGLRELGYVEGENFTIDYRSAEGKLNQLSTLAADLVRLKVEAIVTQGTPAAVAAKTSTKTIPTIISGGTDPVCDGTRS